MEIGNKPTNSEYNIPAPNNNRTSISKVSKEKDLGITVDDQLKFSAHTNAAVTKANKMLGIILRTFIFLDTAIFEPIYKSLIRPHLEYASTTWSPMLKKDIIAIENVQRRATKRISELRTLPYHERLKKLGLPTLEYRRERADMIQLYKIRNKIDIVDTRSMFKDATRTTRGHNQKLFKNHSD